MPGPGGGSIQNMRTTLKNNNRLLRKRSYFEIYKKYYNDAGIDRTTIQKATPAQLEAVRMRLKKSQRNERMKRFVALGVSLVITAGIILYILSATLRIAGRSDNIKDIMNYRLEEFQNGDE